MKRLEGERSLPYDSGRPGGEDAQEKDGEDDEAERFPLDQLLLQALPLALRLRYSGERNSAAVVLMLPALERTKNFVIGDISFYIVYMTTLRCIHACTRTRAHTLRRTHVADSSK